MKILILIIAIAAGWFLWSKMSEKPEVKAVQSTLQDMKKGDTEPVKYVNSLQNDVKKADDVKDKANAAIQKTDQGVDNALKEAGGQ